MFATGELKRRARDNQLVQRFVEQKILREITGQARHRRFRYDSYIHLFTDEEPDLAGLRA